ncbi:MAG: Maf family protein, partial [Paludibacteraceae bacterium]|nr:Maf family protein [Paludibacteraceae bacterium]
AGLGISFDVLTIPGIDESYPDTLVGGDIPVYLAKKKSEAYNDILRDNLLVITADTIVWHNGKVLGKPKDRREAIEMLTELSGDSHIVYTGVCVRTKDKEVSFFTESEVFFDELTSSEIEYYVDNYKPYDKAGSYGIQEWIGYVGVKRIEGSYFNIMGLPIQRLYKELKRFE